MRYDNKRERWAVESPYGIVEYFNSKHDAEQFEDVARPMHNSRCYSCDDLVCNKLGLFNRHRFIKK